MTKKTEILAQKIKEAQNKNTKPHKPAPAFFSGYKTVIDILTNLIGCVLMGLALGVLFQNLFATPSYLTALLTVFGGFVGLVQVVRQAILFENKGDKE
ncbi:MAG: AtpZ/AtpI family protein [Alphaproteobacteria bacterium]|nr:AtpZ/AtpI family protein [Alphaproteobacteria bacterium]